MRSKPRLAVSLLATTALVLVTATAVVAANPHAMYTCTKTKNEKTDVKTSVPEPAVGGLTHAGYTCVAEVQQGDDGDQQGDQPSDEGQDEGTAQDSGPGMGSTPGDDSIPAAADSSAPEPAQVPSESRSLYCSTNGLWERGSAEGSGAALNLPDSQGASLVEKGLVTPAIFYAGIGASCDLLPGFTYAGFWVDHIGEVVPGVAVYRYYVPTAG